MERSVVPNGLIPRLRGAGRPASLVALASMLLLLVFLVSVVPAGAAVSGVSARRVLIVVVDRIGIEDIVDARLLNIQSLASRGSSALMNARVRYDSYGSGSYLILGSGGRALSAGSAGLSFNSDETFQARGEVLAAGAIYHSRTGRRAPAGSVVNLNVEEMKKESETELATSTPGLLGETLKKAGRRVQVFGNADSLEPGFSGGDPESMSLTEDVAQPEPGDSNGHQLVRTSHREASCIAMDSMGLVPAGDVSTEMTVSSNGPGLLGTDFERLITAASSALATSDLVVVDLGQTSRVDEQSDLSSEGALNRARKAALLECDRALGALLESVDLSQDLVIVCAPTPTRKMIAEGDFLTPFLAAGPGLAPGSRLSSPTTRRSGLVSNYDLAPTVLERLGEEVPSEMDGRAMTSDGTGLELGSLAEYAERSVYASSARRVLLDLFTISGLAILLLLLMLSLVRRESIFDHPLFWSVVLLSLLSGPLVYMLVPLLPIKDIGWSIAVSVICEILAGALTLIALRAVGRSRVQNDGREAGSGYRLPGATGWALPRAVLLLSGLTLTVVLLDPFLGSPMSTVSPFGTSMVLGGRYYGIGNTGMGLALGASILVACLVPDIFASRFKSDRVTIAAAAILLIVTAFIIGYPRLGANVGGLITGVAAAFVTLVKLRGGEIGWKQAVLIAVVVVACLALLLLADTLLPGSSSHAGKTASRISGNGIGDAFDVLARKLEANLKLALSSVWRLFFLAGVIAALVWRWNLAMFKEIRSAYPHMPAAWTGMAVAMAVALVFNDTGIEAAGAIMVFFILPALLLLLSVCDRRDSVVRGLEGD